MVLVVPRLKFLQLEELVPDKGLALSQGQPRRRVGTVLLVFNHDIHIPDIGLGDAEGEIVGGLDIDRVLHAVLVFFIITDRPLAELVEGPGLVLAFQYGHSLLVIGPGLVRRDDLDRRGLDLEGGLQRALDGRHGAQGVRRAGPGLLHRLLDLLGSGNVLVRVDHGVAFLRKGVRLKKRRVRGRARLGQRRSAKTVVLFRHGGRGLHPGVPEKPGHAGRDRPKMLAEAEISGFVFLLFHQDIPVGKGAVDLPSPGQFLPGLDAELARCVFIMDLDV